MPWFAGEWVWSGVAGQLCLSKYHSCLCKHLVIRSVQVACMCGFPGTGKQRKMKEVWNAYRLKSAKP